MIALNPDQVVYVNLDTNQIVVGSTLLVIPVSLNDAKVVVAMLDRSPPNRRAVKVTVLDDET